LSSPTLDAAIRGEVRGEVQGVGYRDATACRARELGLMGWVRNGPDAVVLVHAEGARPALDVFAAFLAVGPPLARVAGSLDRAGRGRGSPAVRDCARPGSDVVGEFPRSVISGRTLDEIRK